MTTSTIVEPEIDEPPASAPKVSRLARWLRPANVLPTIVTLIVAYLVLYPLYEIALGSFKVGVPASPGPLTLSGWRAIFQSDNHLWKTAWTSISIAVPRALLTLFLAASFAWLLTRTNVPFKRVLFGMMTFMFILPDLPWILAWGLLGADRVGLLNQWFSDIFPGITPINVYSYWGLVILGACRSSVYLFFFLYPAFLAMDASLEEAARMSGANTVRATIKITIPLMAPALLGALVFTLIHSLSSFELEQLLGTPAGITVFTTSIYQDIYGGQNLFAEGSAQSLLLLVVTFGLLAVQFRLLKGRNFATITGRGFRVKPIDIGKWRWPAFGAISLFFIFMGALPSVILVLGSFLQFPGLLRFDLFTDAHWATALNDPFVIDSIRNTIVVAICAATIGVIASFVISYIAVKTSWKGRKVLEVIAWLPWAIPGTVLALGFLYAFVSLPIYGTLAILVVAFVARGLPIGMRFTTPALIQLGPELEESARINGATWKRTASRIMMPLMRPAIGGAWIFLFVTAVRVLDTILILTSPNTRVISVDIFQAATTGGREGEAYVLAIVQAVIVFVGYAVARLILRPDRITKA